MQRFVEGCAQDIRYALRLVVRHPGFSLIAIVTLALGIGANTALFSVVHAVLLRPLPYPEPHRLVQFEREVNGSFEGSRHYASSYRFLRDHTRAYAHVASFMYRGGLTLVAHDGSGSASLEALAVTPAYFAALGVPPARGRAFTEAEAAVNGPDAVILSHDIWQRMFQGDPGVLERAVLLGGRPHQVVGIMPARFVGRPRMDLWIPLRPGPHDGGLNVGVLGRLRADATLAHAQAEMDSLLPAWHRAVRDTPRPGFRLRVGPFQREEAAALTPPLVVLMVTVASVLLIACANLANLLLARATTRVREIAVRATLGASHTRLVRQLIVEGLVLALAGGVCGVLLAYWTLPALLAIGPVSQEYWGTIGLDGRVLAFACALSIVTGIVFSLAPALQATRVSVSEACKEGGRVSGGRHAGLLRHVLIVGEVAASVALLIGALLLVQTFRNLIAVEPGFDPRRLIVAQMPMANARYDTAAALRQFYRTGLERIRQIPGVESAAIVLNAPMENGLNVPIVVGSTGSGDDAIRAVDWRYITPDYFGVMRTPVIKGRAFTERDTASTPAIAIVNQQFVRTYVRDRDPIGYRIQMHTGRDDDEPSFVEIVGVVADMKQRSLSEPVPETMYVPLGQVRDSVRNAHVWFPVNWIVRTRGEDGAVADALPRVLRAVDPQQPFSRIRTMESMIGETMTSERFHMLLVGSCALLAVVLAAAGLFGVISFVVAQRGHEMSVRLALGATAGQLVGSVVRQGAAMATVGVIIGLAAAFALTRLLAAFLFGISTTDPVTFASAALLLLVLATLASLLPALRLIRLDPASVLRQS